MTTISTQQQKFSTWSHLLSDSIVELRKLASTTEQEFLTVGSQMQKIYSHATEFASTANDLVGTASGETIHGLSTELFQMLANMEAYRKQIEHQRTTSTRTFSQVVSQLLLIHGPLEGFQKMSKHLYILEVLIKIESAYMGEIGSEFVNLALDIRKLSLAIKEKARTIRDQQEILTSTITRNVPAINTTISKQENQIGSILEKTGTSLHELDEVTHGFSELGHTIAQLADENTARISDIVQSMQFHDIYRQQVEHIAEALESLPSKLSDMVHSADNLDEEHFHSFVSNMGDVCEIQEAQLSFASQELHAAVMAIITNLQDIGKQQKDLSADIHTRSGSIDSSGTSFVDNVRNDMSSIAHLLASCATSNQDMTAIIAEVGTTVNAITAFVADIEEIGHEVIQIALNARIKAARTGTDGDSLSSLSEEIGQLSEKAVGSTTIITTTLTDVRSITTVLETESGQAGAALNEDLATLTNKLNHVLNTLEEMGNGIGSLLLQTGRQVDSLNREIEKLISGIEVHNRCKTMADKITVKLQALFTEARQMYPATTSFKNDLRQLSTKYTMESERKIHEQIANKKGKAASQPAAPKSSTRTTISKNSEFGDNVDLF